MTNGAGQDSPGHDDASQQAEASDAPTPYKDFEGTDPSRVLKVTQEGRLLTVMLNRPEVLNAITSAEHDEFSELWYRVAHDDSVGAVILTGAGRAFCAGANMKKMKGQMDTAGSAETESDLAYARARAIRSDVPAKWEKFMMLNVQQPIVGAINGDAVGYGCMLAFSCDIIVANETARFADTHVKNLGVVAGDGGTILIPQSMSIHKAKEFLLLSEFLNAGDAARSGIINYALPADDVMPKAREIALRLAYGPQWAIRWTKAAVNRILMDQFMLTWDAAHLAERLCFASEDHREAVRAFIEKREPRYTFK